MEWTWRCKGCKEQQYSYDGAAEVFGYCDECAPKLDVGRSNTCDNCGALIVQGWRFCPFCSAPIY